MDVVKLLQNKSRCLQRFVEESSGFLAQAESGEMTRLEAFLEGRESILRALELFDRKIDETVAATPTNERTQALRDAVGVELKVQAQWLDRSAKIDERISNLLQLEATRLRKAAAASGKGRKTLSKFKSSQGLDHEL